MTEPRDQALSALYAAESSNELDLTDISKRAKELAFGTWESRAELDEAIGAVSDRWRDERMPLIDRNVIRLALFELRHRPDTPAAVVISEAVRMAKEFSTEKSGGFVNGVLSKLAAETRPRTSEG